MSLVLPHIFVDRSLGGIQVPALLRAADLELTTMAEHYGEAGAQRATDVEWIALTAQRGWISFHKDAQIRRNFAERLAVLSYGARMFCLARADLTAAEAASRFTSNLDAIRIAAQQDGPFIYVVKAAGIVRVV